ncbi:MAG: endonuclease, partial [Lentisphaerae bacterium]|nr:endonuclease [Lentisphaerota bacterium]
MRLLLYNIRYGTGRASRHFPLTSYFGRTTETLAKITEFIRLREPDIVGLI